MKKEELDKLWELYREFCNRVTITSVYTPDFLTFLEKFKIEEE